MGPDESYINGKKKYRWAEKDRCSAFVEATQAHGCLDFPSDCSSAAHTLRYAAATARLYVRFPPPIGACHSARTILKVIPLLQLIICRLYLDDYHHSSVPS